MVSPNEDYGEKQTVQFDVQLLQSKPINVKETRITALKHLPPSRTKSGCTPSWEIPGN